MPTENTSLLEPPGPGSWSLDTAHFPRPVTRFVTELFAAPARLGFKEATHEYGLLLDHIEWGFVDRWAYLCPRPVGPLAGAGDPLTKEHWDALVGDSPLLRERLATSDRVFVTRSWREEVRRWHQWTKPALRRDHMALQIAGSHVRGAEGLRTYLDRCRDNLRRSIYHHHRLNVAPVIPMGDFLVHAADWTGRPCSELAQLVRSDGELPGGQDRQLAELAAVLRDHPSGVAALASDEPPATVLAALAVQPPPVGPAVTAYTDLVGCWTVGGGSDVGEPCLREMPHVVLEALRTAVQGGTASSPAASDADRVAEVRSGVPADARAMFDELLVEAQHSHRVRDERATYCDVWAYGVARQAILAAGAHLAATGAIAEPELLLEAGHGEIQSLLLDGAGPSSHELAERARYRANAPERTMPVTIGGPTRSPVPTQWLPAGAARTERAFRTYVGAMSAPAQQSPRSHRTLPGGAVIRGLAASPGVFEGPARVIRAAAELAQVRRGDVLVSGTMTPAFNAVLPLVGAIVTDQGGALSHAAIVARDYGIPAVVGTREATRRIPEGSFVTVDGGTGTVEVRT